MPPPDQGFRSRDAAGLDIDLRLIVNLEFAPRHRMTQLILEGKSLDAVLIDVARVELIVVPAGSFCPIHRDVGILEQ